MHPVMHPFVYEASGVYGPGAGETGCGRGSSVSPPEVRKAISRHVVILGGGAVVFSPVSPDRGGLRSVCRARAQLTCFFASIGLAQPFLLFGGGACSQKATRQSTRQEGRRCRPIERRREQ